MPYLSSLSHSVTQQPQAWWWGCCSLTMQIYNSNNFNCISNADLCFCARTLSATLLRTVQYHRYCTGPPVRKKWLQQWNSSALFCETVETFFGRDIFAFCLLNFYAKKVALQQAKCTHLMAQGAGKHLIRSCKVATSSRGKSSLGIF